MNYPIHLAIIPDGNRTRAKINQKSSLEWHLAWVKKTVELTQFVFSQTPIKVFTWRWLSTENIIQRTPEEIAYLLELYKVAWSLLDDFLLEQQINFHRVGSTEWLTSDFLEYLFQKEKNLTFDTDRHVNFCINYGWRDEIIRGINKILQTNKTSITQDEFTAQLDFAKQPCVDFVIRTKGNKAQRTSGFMSRWIGYAELYFSDQLYPDFSIQDLKQALDRYSSVVNDRNFGK